MPKLFEGLEALNRKPRGKRLLKRVTDAYELLGKLREKERVLEKYNYLFTEKESPKKSKPALKEKEETSKELLNHKLHNFAVELSGK